MWFLKPEAKLFRASLRFIVPMSLQTAIPWRFALQHCPPPLHRPVSIFSPPKLICQPAHSGKPQNWTRRLGQGKILTQGWAKSEYRSGPGRSIELIFHPNCRCPRGTAYVFADFGAHSRAAGRGFRDHAVSACANSHCRSHSLCARYRAWNRVVVSQWNLEQRCSSLARRCREEPP